MLYYIKQNLIAIDQFANALFGGYADETISARAYRMSLVSAHWVYVRKAIDLLFFFERNHCYMAWVSEFERHQLPLEYRNYGSL
jgi:hypothetical protein